MIASVHTAIKVASLAVAASLAPLTGPPLAAGHYTTIKVPGGTNVSGEGISDSGVIVGCDHRNGKGRGFIENGKKFTVLADPKAGAKGSTCASAINNRGVIVGDYGSFKLHGFVFKDGKFTTIDEPQAASNNQGTVAVDVNDSGVVVGYYYRSTGSLGFVLRKGKFTSISFPGHPHAKNRITVANGITDGGVISGAFYYGADNAISFLYHDGIFRPFSVPHAKKTEVACISERGDVIVGEYQATTKAPFQGFIFRNGDYRTLRTASGRSTWPQCGNSHGDVVGYVQGKGSATSGFLFTPRT